MMNILLNESDRPRQQLLRKRLQQQGNRVWPVNKLYDAKSRMKKVKFDLMIVDADAQRIDDITTFIEHYDTLPVLLQASRLDSSLDFRYWIADALVEKNETGDNVVDAVTKLLGTNLSREDLC